MHDAPHESPATMTLPLVVLAGLAIVGGVIQLPFTKDLHFLEEWLHPVIGANEADIDVATGTKVGLAVIAVARRRRRHRHRLRHLHPQGPRADRARDPRRGLAATTAPSRAFVGGPGRAGFEGVATFDRVVVDGAVNGVGGPRPPHRRGLRRAQSGYVRSYALGIAGGAVVLLAYFLAQVTF